MTDPYRIRPPEVWVQARNDYLAGLDAEAVCHRHDLGLSAFRRRARKYGWRRSDQDAPAPKEINLEIYIDIGVNDQIETAYLRFVEALTHGRATDALRWRRLWSLLCEQRDAFDAEFYAGMTPDEIKACNVSSGDEESEAEIRLLSTPVETPEQPGSEPSAQAPARRENVHDVHSIFSRVHISDGERPYKRAQRRQRGRDQRTAGLSPPPAGP